MGDLSRWSFDAFRDFSTVLSQQGRVDTDADRNEWGAILARRMQAEALDTLGRSAVPRETPDGFRIEVAAGELTIGCGRIYVDGLLAENHGTALKFDTHLAELSGEQHAGEPIVPGIAFEDQPYAPFLLGNLNLTTPFVVPNTAGPHVAYLKVWNREVTAVEDPRLVEKALGVDTSARLQTVWQVRVIPDAGANVDCKTALADVPKFLEAEPIAAARLTFKTVDAAATSGPCDLPRSGGYRGLENQLYRVEIQAGGHTGATFKWSRDNGSVASRVKTILSTTKLVVESVGRDEVLRFSSGDWVEITDDWRELQGLPGVLRRISPNQGVDDVTGTLVLESPISASDFPADNEFKPDPARNMRVRRWDQRGVVLNDTGGTVVDLDAAGADGAIPIPAGGGFVVLESNIAVAFHLDPAAGQYRSGDYWLIAARTSDASIDELQLAPPLGIHAHYAKLAIFTLPDSETDCRTLWPPESGDDCCDCTVCVSPESERSGEMTIQKAIGLIRETGGTICLGTGDFLVKTRIDLSGARKIRIRGHGPATRIHPIDNGPAFLIARSEDITLENFEAISGITNGQAMVTVADSVGVALFRLGLEVDDVREKSPAAGVELQGKVERLSIRECRVAAVAGITAGVAERRMMASEDLWIEDNRFDCAAFAVRFDRRWVHLGELRLRGNVVRGCATTGFHLLGAVGPGGTVHVAGNQLAVHGHGILAATDRLLIADNEIESRSESATHGIGLVPGDDALGIGNVRILANRVTGFGGHGVRIATSLGSGMIKLNVFGDLGGGGVVMESSGPCGDLVVENNQLIEVGRRARRDVSVAGFSFGAVRDLDVRGNAISGVSRGTEQSVNCAGILVASCRNVRIDANHIAGIGSSFGGSATGILVAGAFDEVSIASNSVHRRLRFGERLPGDDRTENPAPFGFGEWCGIFVRGGLLIREAAAETPATFMKLASFKLLNVLDESKDPQNRRIVLFTGARVIALPVRRGGTVAVVDNSVATEASTQPPLFVTAVEGCRVANNRLVAIHPPEGLTVASFVGASHAAVTSNELRGAVAGRDNVVLRIVVATELRGDPCASVVGNLPNGIIHVNGSPLAAPWLALNPYTSV